jgi:hypothetical protein
VCSPHSSSSMPATYFRFSFPCAFALSRKLPIILAMSVHSPVFLSVCPNIYQRGSRWMDLREISYWEFLRRLVKFQIWLKSGQNISHFTWRPKYVLLMSVKSQ